MFQQQLAPDQGRRLIKVGTLLSAAIHVVVIAGIAMIGPSKVVQEVQNVGVKFVSALPPPVAAPPPPPAGHKTHKNHITKKVSTHIEIPKKPAPAEPVEEDDAVEGGVVGGVKGGVAGGVVGGVVGGTVGGAPPKNVPPFVIAKDALSQPKPRLSEVFMTSHRGRGTVTGMYKVCVGVDGRVFQVVAVKSVPGADADIIQAVKGWVYKPQQVPVCFLYNMPITIQ